MREQIDAYDDKHITATSKLYLRGNSFKIFGEGYDDLDATLNFHFFYMGVFLL